MLAVDLPAQIEIDPNVPAGEVLWSTTVTPYLTAAGDCTGNASANMLLGGGGAANSAWNSFVSGVLGVGIRVKVLYRDCPQGYLSQSCSSSFGPSAPDPMLLVIELIRLDEEVGAGTLLSGISRWSWNGEAYAFFQTSRTVSVRLRRPPTCSVSSKGSIQAPLGNVAATTFKGVGSTSPARPFSIDLTCKGGNGVSTLDVYATLTDATKPDNRSNVLTLSPGSGAKGVGVEVLSGTTVLGYGPDSSALGNPGQWKAGTVFPGSSVFSIPLTAHYVQTEPVVTAGTANARATFTMSYQ